jgi:hypothetical protein
MYVKYLHPAASVALALGLSTSVAWGWVEGTIQSDVITVNVERSGEATVAHEIVMRVKGGPLTGFDLEGVDSDAVPMPDATVSSAAAGSPAANPLPLLLHKREDGGLRIEIDSPKGIRRGTYLFKLGYRTNLVARDLVKPLGSMVELRWVGPRFNDGLDSARVIFRLPPAATPPRLPGEDSSPGAGEEAAGTFLSNLRRAHDKDELEVVRPHVAKGEPVEWRLLASASSFQAFAPEQHPAPSDSAPLSPARRPIHRVLAGLCLAVIAIIYSALVGLKWRAVSKACELAGARPRALIPLSPVVRAVGAGTALASAAAVGALTDIPTLAGLLLVVAMAFAAHRSPALLPQLRGPGQWLPLNDTDAFEAKEPRLPGRWFDVGALPGFASFVVALGGFTWAAFKALSVSPYYALLVLLAAACLLPIFCTGRARELPANLVVRPRRVLAWLAARLRKDKGLRVVPWARIPDGRSEPDELRLLVMPRAALAGLMAIEVGMEYEQGGGGPVALPCVIVRALDGSPSYRALPRNVVWTRGRKPEERVAVVRLSLPTRAALFSLVERLTKLLREDRPQRPRAAQVSSKPKSSAGKGASTAKPRRTSSPAHAT